MGESRYAARFLRAAIDAGHEVVGVCPTGDAGQPDALAAAASAAGVPTFPAWPLFAGAHSAVKASGAELLVLANVGRIAPADLLRACPRGAICFHPSLLPRHRGKRAVAAAIRSGDAMTGVSIFWPDEGADTGPLLLQVPVTVTPGDTPMTLYHDKLVPTGIFAMLAAVAAVEAGCAARIPQEEAAA